jgi:hypothetical protein
MHANGSNASQWLQRVPSPQSLERDGRVLAELRGFQFRSAQRNLPHKRNGIHYKNEIYHTHKIYHANATNYTTETKFITQMPTKFTTQMPTKFATQMTLVRYGLSGTDVSLQSCAAINSVRRNGIDYANATKFTSHTKFTAQMQINVLH